MPQLYILCLSLFIIPLAGTLIIGPFLSIPNAAEAKDFLALTSLLAIVLAGSLYPRVPTKQRQHNVPLYLLMIFLPLSAYSVPPLRLMYGGGNVGGLWIWHATAWAFAYFMAYQAVICLPVVREKHTKMIARSIGWSAIISAGYAYVQFLNIDQWQFARPYQHIGNPLAVNVTAMVGNPTFLGVFLCICLPFLWLFFKKRWALFVSGAVLITRSDFAICGVFFVPVLIACFRARSTVWLKVLGGIGLAGILCMAAFWGDIRPRITDNGRLVTWEQTWQDWQGPCIKIPILPTMTDAQKIEIETLNKRNYAFTGRGLGSFPYIFGVSHNSRWENPHNEYLHSLYTIGLIGTVLFILAIGFVFLKTFSFARGNTYCLALYVSLAYICFAAIGIPVVNSEPLRYFSFAIFSLLVAMIPL